MSLPSSLQSQADSNQRFYDAFAPHYDEFYELIDYAEWAAIIHHHLSEIPRFSLEIYRKIGEQEVMPAPLGDSPIFLEDISEDRGKRILELGCGTGAMLRELVARFGQTCFGLDLSREMLQQCKSKFDSGHRPPLVQCNGSALSFLDASFDLILAPFSWLNLFASPARKILLQETHRVLRPNGVFLTDFATVHRYHQLRKEGCSGGEASHTEATYEIKQTFLLAKSNSTLSQWERAQDRFVVERTLIALNQSVSKRFHFLDTKRIKKELIHLGYQLVKLLPLLADHTDSFPKRMLLIARKI